MSLSLMAAVCWIILLDLVYPKAESWKTGFFALCGLMVALVAVTATYGYSSIFSMVRLDPGQGTAAYNDGPIFAFSRMLVLDKLGDFFKALFLLGTVGVVIFSIRSKELEEGRFGEYYALLLASVAASCFLVSSNNFLMLVLSLETLSLSSYVLAGYVKGSRLTAEASIKYVLYGSVASGVMLFGISYIYGMSGTLDIQEALVRVAQREQSELAISLAFMLAIGGMAFKMAAVPFHFWAPDVYQGAPTPVTAFLSVVSKAAGFSALFRVTLPLFAVQGGQIPDAVLAVRGPLLGVIHDGHLPLLFWVLSVASMTLGNLVAIRQSDIKRLLAYSSIAHAGYILMGMTVFSNDSLEAMLFYFFVYTLMNLGAFLVVIVMMNKTGSSSLEAYRGILWRNPFLAIAMFILLVSLTGLPPTAGFLGKWRILMPVLAAGNAAIVGGQMTAGAWFYYSLALIGMVNSVVSLYVYMRVAKYMIFMKPREEGAFPIPLFDYGCLLVYTAPVLLMIIQFGPILTLVKLFDY